MMERLRSILEAMGVLNAAISNDEIALSERVSPVLWLEVPEPEGSTDARRLAALR